VVSECDALGVDVAMWLSGATTYRIGAVDVIRKGSAL
jgi:hypothetical protein